MKSSQAFFGGVKQDVEKHLNGKMLHACLNVSVSDMTVRKRGGFQFLAVIASDNFPTSLSYINLPEQGYIGQVDCYKLAGTPDATVSKHFTVRF